ncbi:MAG: cytochrome-c oxidase, cbb3-type subunit III [Pseudomonadota bacterium]
MAAPEIDDLSGIETTGHEWDGLKELNNPLPKWWLWTFYGCIVWGIIYVILFPAWPMVNGATQGLLGYDSRLEVAETIADAQAEQAVYIERIAELEIEDVAADPELMQFAVAGGAAIFRTYCSQCHGAGAAGAMAAGYPNLNDDAWLWGGQMHEIYQTVAHGIRWEADDDTRLSAMPAYGADDLLTNEEIDAVVEFVWALSHTGEDEEVDWEMANLGAEIFEANCAACHGDQAIGNHDLGAPNLIDAIWLYGGDRATLRETVYYARAGVMPPWIDRLGDAGIKQVALYVHSLGGGEATSDEE